VAAGVALLLFGGGTAGISLCCRRMDVDGLRCFDWMGSWIVETLTVQQQQTPCISLPQPAVRERALDLADRSARSSGA
jgi:hypothetical protein